MKKGKTMEEIERERKRCEEAIERISKIPRRTSITSACTRTLLKLARSELRFFSRPADSFPPTLSSNIGHLEAVIHLLAHHPGISGVSRVCKPIPVPSKVGSHSEGTAHVDVVCSLNGRPVWVVVSDRNPKHLNWGGSGSEGKGEDFRVRIQRVLRLCNSQNALAARPASVVVFFARGVKGCVSDGLRGELGASELELPEELLRFDFEFCEERDSSDVAGNGWVEVVPSCSRSYREARLLEIKVCNWDIGTGGVSLVAVPLSGGILGVGDDGFGRLVKGMKGCDVGLDGGGDLVNFDTTALVAIVSGISNGCADSLLNAPEAEMRRRFKGNYEFVIAQAKSEIENAILAELAGILSGKRGIICEAVVSEFKSLVLLCGGPNEKSRADTILRCLSIVPDCPSERLISLPTTRKLALKNKIVFGTGDQLHASTLTANMAFVRAVSQTGMSLCSIEHRPRALTCD